jgi:hypothetical protein
MKKTRKKRKTKAERNREALAYLVWLEERETELMIMNTKDLIQ